MRHKFSLQDQQNPEKFWRNFLCSTVTFETNASRLYLKLYERKKFVDNIKIRVKKNRKL